MRTRQRLMMMALSLTMALPGIVSAQPDQPGDAPTRTSLREDRLPGQSQRRSRNPRLAPEDVQDALEVLRDYRPELADDIETWRQQKPEDAAKLIRQHMPWIGRLVESRRQDPVGYGLRLRDLQLHRQSRQLADQLQQARQQDDPDQVQALAGQLRELVAEHFEARQQVRRHALERMERMITRLRGQLETRQQARDELIDRRVERLTATDQTDKGEEW